MSCILGRPHGQVNTRLRWEIHAAQEVLEARRRRPTARPRRPTPRANAGDGAVGFWAGLAGRRRRSSCAEGGLFVASDHGRCFPLP
jgi:hypothetical protein